MVFTHNEGKIERIIRLAIGLVLIAIAVTAMSGMGIWMWVAGVVGLMMLVTGATGICPLYTVIGRVTHKEDMCPTCSPKEANAVKRS